MKTAEEGGVFAAGVIDVPYVQRNAITKEDAKTDPTLLQKDSSVFHLWTANLNGVVPKIADKITDTIGTWIVRCRPQRPRLKRRAAALPLRLHPEYVVSVLDDIQNAVVADHQAAALTIGGNSLTVVKRKLPKKEETLDTPYQVTHLRGKETADGDTDCRGPKVPRQVRGGDDPHHAQRSRRGDEPDGSRSLARRAVGTWDKTRYRQWPR